MKKQAHAGSPWEYDWMRTLLGTAFVSVLLILTSMPAEATSVTGTIISAKDKRGDVKLLKSKAISRVQKKSIDIDKVSIQTLSNSKIRFKVRVKKVIRSKKWDQMVFFSGHDDDNGQFAYSGVSFRIRNSRAAFATQSVTENLCNLKVRRSGRQVWVDVPRRCAPTAGETLTVGTATGQWQSDEDSNSSDALSLGVMPPY